MAVQVNEKCIKCGVCVPVCPNGALEVIDTEQRVHVYTKKCQECGTCVEACPVGALELPGAAPVKTETTETAETETSQ